MEDYLLQKRIAYLEKVVEKLIKNSSVKNAAKNNTSGKVSDVATGDNSSVVSASFKLKYKRVQLKDPKTGGLITVTHEDLVNDTELLNHMIEKHADCFDQLPTPAGE